MDLVGVGEHGLLRWGELKMVRMGEGVGCRVDEESAQEFYR